MSGTPETAEERTSTELPSEIAGPLDGEEVEELADYLARTLTAAAGMAQAIGRMAASRYQFTDGPRVWDDTPMRPVLAALTETLAECNQCREDIDDILG